MTLKVYDIVSCLAFDLVFEIVSFTISSFDIFKETIVKVAHKEVVRLCFHNLNVVRVNIIRFVSWIHYFKKLTRTNEKTVKHADSKNVEVESVKAFKDRAQ